MVLNFINLVKNNLSDNYNSNKIGLHSLNQGKNHLIKKNNDILNAKLNFKENLVGHSDLKSVSTNELNILAKLEKIYNQKLSRYSSEYSTFMTSYYNFISKLNDCKANCRKVYPNTGSTFTIRKRQTCEAGCDFKGPYILQCASTYKGLRTDRSKQCADVTKGRCSNGSVVLGKESEVTNAANADFNNKTIKSGCCECGGGLGGPPNAIINGKKFTKCDNIWQSYYTSPNDAKSKGLINSCKNAVFADTNQARNMHVSYKSIIDKNKELIKLAQQIFTKINALRKKDSTLKGILDEQSKKLQRQINIFSTTMTDIKSLDSSGGQDNATLLAQLEDIKYKENSNELKILLWGSLAIIILFYTIRRLSN